MRQFLKGMLLAAYEMLGHEIPFVCLMINGQESFRAHEESKYNIGCGCTSTIMEKPPFIFISDIQET